MNRRLLVNLASAVAVGIILYASIDVSAGTACCDKSEPACQSKNVGDSCGGGNQCVTFVSPCTKKKSCGRRHPWVLQARRTDANARRDQFHKTRDDASLRQKR